MYKILSIAGSDSGGGAGIQADIKTIEDCGCYATTAITAVTVQNTLGVSAVHAIPATIVAQQIEAVLSDIGADAIKIGMLQSADIVQAVADTLSRYPVPHVVLDPVMVSTSGHPLMSAEGIALLRQALLPYVSIITPNIPEAELLLGHSIPDSTVMPDAARELAHLLEISVLLKGGHLSSDQLVDIFYDVHTGQLTQLPSVRVDSHNTHGTGCTMSSALACALAQGYTPTDAARYAKSYINDAIVAAAHDSIGHGTGPVCHMIRRKPQQNG